MSCRLLVQAAKSLRAATLQLRFAPPVAYVYHPLEYAWTAHEQYLRRYGAGRKRVLFIGMNPGPFGMAQTGVPFGEVKAVRDWLGIVAPVGRPEFEHPNRPIRGFACARSEVSGRRLWRLFARRYHTPGEFFREHFVVNYCPLVFIEKSGCNRTPDKLPQHEQRPLFAACDDHLRTVVRILRPHWLIGVGRFAAARAREACGAADCRPVCILHPSPACPAANRSWARTVTGSLRRLGVWDH